MRDVSDETRQLILDPASGGGGFDAVWVADLMYDGDRRLQNIPISGPSFSWDRSRFVEGSGSLNVVWSDDFGGSMIPRQIGDWFSPFGAELQIDMLIRAGRYQDRIPMSRFVINSVPDADDRRMLFQGVPITPGEVFGLELVDRLEKVNRDEFRFPTRPSTTSAWAEIQSITGFPILRNVEDASVPSTVAYEGGKTQVINQLFDLLGAWPQLTPDGTLTALPKAWGEPVDEIRGRVSAPIRMESEKTYNAVVVEGKNSEGDPIFAVADVTEGFLRVRNLDGGVSPFGSKVYRYASQYLDTYDKCAAYAAELLPRVSRVRGVTRNVVEPLNPLREIGDVLRFDGGVVRVDQIRHRQATTELVVEVPE